MIIQQNFMIQKGRYEIMKIYISGSIYGGTQKIETYKILIKELEKYGQVMNKQVADENTISNEAYQKDEDIFSDLEKKII